MTTATTSTPAAATAAKTTLWDTKHLVLAVVSAAAITLAWSTYREGMRDRVRMQATISAEEQQRKQDEADLKTKLDAIEKDKSETKTPQQIIQEIPKYIPLPQPIAAAESTSPSARNGPSVPITRKSDARKSDQSGGLPEAPKIQGAMIPADDLKPLYKFGANCQECQLKLADAQKQITALTTERDAAVKAAKGGSFWMRLKRNAHWFAVGAGVAAATLCGTGHCK